MDLVISETSSLEIKVNRSIPTNPACVEVFTATVSREEVILSGSNWDYDCCVPVEVFKKINEWVEGKIDDRS